MHQEIAHNYDNHPWPQSLEVPLQSSKVIRGNLLWWTDVRYFDHLRDLDNVRFIPLGIVQLLIPVVL